MKNNEGRKTKLAYIWACITLAAVIIVAAGVLTASTHVLPLFLGIIAIAFGPICGIMYLIEIRKGVLAMEEEEQ